MAIIKNTILARYEGGHVDVDMSQAPNSRIEQYLELANVRTRKGAIDLSKQQLRILRSDRRTFAFQGQVRSAEQALGQGFQVGDKFDGDMIASVQVSADVDGTVTTVPEVNDPVLLAQWALERRIARIAAGVTSEYANPKTDKQNTGKGTDTTPPIWSQPNALVETFSEAWTAPRPYWWSWLELVLNVAGDTATRVQVLRIGPGPQEVLGEAVLAAGDRRCVGVINRGVATGDQTVLSIQTAGTDAQNLTATPRGTMV